MLAWVMNLDFAASGAAAPATGNKRKSLLALKLAQIVLALMGSLFL